MKQYLYCDSLPENKNGSYHFDKNNLENANLNISLNYTAVGSEVAV